MFYEQITKICKEKGLKLTPLLKELGVSTGNTGSWKKGASPRTDVLNALAARLEVSTDYLLGNTDDPTSADKKKASSEPMGSKEALKQFLIKEGVIPVDRDVTEEEAQTLSALADAFFNKGKK